MKLEKHLTDTSVWASLKRELTSERESLRATLEQTSLSHDDSQVLRGELRMIAKLMALDEYLPDPSAGVAPEYDT